MNKALCRGTILILCVSASATATEPKQDAAAKRPNVLFIAADDLNHWVGYLNRNPQTITPNIDRLADRGVHFTHSYCAAPVCNASRAALMSGLRPSSSGIYDNNNDWRDAIAEDLPLTTTFRKAGYYVVGAGKIYHARYARRSEWDDYLDDEGVDPLPVENRGVKHIGFAPLDCRDEDMREWRIVDYAIEQLGRKHDKPFFLAVGLHKPHDPWSVPRKYFDMHPLDQIQLPPITDNDLDDVPRAGKRMAKGGGDHAEILAAGRWKEAVQAYLATISFADAMIGRLIEALDASEYRENTMIVFWGDHGYHLGEKEHWRKSALWEETTRAPLIWVVPGVTRLGGVCERTVDFMSIYPTLTDLAGIPTPKHVEGKSIQSLLADPLSEWHDPAISTYQFNNHAVRSEAFRYIRYANGDEEFYDEVVDPYEWSNLAGESRVAAEKAALARYIPTVNAPEIPKTGSNKTSKAEKQAAVRSGAN
ncbi:MAG: sulfatase [Pirellulales bacterium]